LAKGSAKLRKIEQDFFYCDILGSKFRLGSVRFVAIKYISVSFHTFSNITPFKMLNFSNKLIFKILLTSVEKTNEWNCSRFKVMGATQCSILSEFQFLDQQNAQVSNFTSF